MDMALRLKDQQAQERRRQRKSSRRALVKWALSSTARAAWAMKRCSSSSKVLLVEVDGAALMNLTGLSRGHYQPSVRSFLAWIRLAERKVQRYSSMAAIHCHLTILAAFSLLWIHLRWDERNFQITWRRSLGQSRWSCQISESSLRSSFTAMDF